MGENQGLLTVSLHEVAKLILLWAGSLLLGSRAKTRSQNQGVLFSPLDRHERPQRYQVSRGHWALLISKQHLIGSSAFSLGFPQL